MPRSRNIKPGFFLNEELVELPYEYRLLFIGLWTLADREGRLENRPKKIKMQIFPADDLDIPRALLGLSEKRLITIYSIDNKSYIYINKFLKHQHPHHKETESIIPSHKSLGQDLDKHQTDPADSLILIPDSLIPIKHSSDHSNERITKTPQKKIPYKEIVDIYHKILPLHSKVEVLSVTRKGYLKRLWFDDDGIGLPDLHHWENFFTYVKQSQFLTGQVQSHDRKPFIPNLEWLTKPANYLKITEGFYHG